MHPQTVCCRRSSKSQNVEGHPELTSNSYKTITIVFQQVLPKISKESSTICLDETLCEFHLIGKTVTNIKVNYH